MPDTPALSVSNVSVAHLLSGLHLTHWWIFEIKLETK